MPVAVRFRISEVGRTVPGEPPSPRLGKDASPYPRYRAKRFIGAFTQSASRFAQGLRMTMGSENGYTIS
jgi:hypothetical protein